MTFEEKEMRRLLIAAAQIIKDAMTPEEKIAFLNTPYKDMPPELKTGMTQNPQMFNFVRVTHKNIGPQKETFAARLIRYREKYHLSQAQFCDLCNEFAKQYDLPTTIGHKAQRTRITMRDMCNYENFNVSPKIDKMTIIAEATGLSIDYFGGYGAKNRRSRKNAA
jgi:transcriptional regulator with XRE-family HTH domain